MVVVSTLGFRVINSRLEIELNSRLESHEEEKEHPGWWWVWWWVAPPFRSGLAVEGRGGSGGQSRRKRAPGARRAWWSLPSSSRLSCLLEDNSLTRRMEGVSTGGATQSTLQNVRRFRGGLVFKSHGLLYHSTLGLRCIKKKKSTGGATGVPWRGQIRAASSFEDIRLRVRV